MSHIALPDAAGRIDTFTRSEGADTVHMQAVVPVDPATGALLPLAQEATLAALSNAVVTLNAAASAIQSAVEALNSKTTAVNTGAIAGTVALDAPTLAALESITAETGLAQALTDAQLRAAAVPVSGAFYPATQPVSGTVSVANMVSPGLTDAELRAAALPVVGAFYPATQPVSAAALPLPTGAATETTLAALDAKLPALSAGRIPVELPAGGGGLTDSELRASPLPVVTKGYDAVDDMVKIKSVQKKFRDSFVGSSLNAAKWDSTLGTGGAITVASGTLTLGSGTTASAETYVLSKETFTIPFRVNIGLTLSQRIANQTFLVEAVSVDAVTGIPDGLHCVALLWDGTTATQAKYRAQNSGATPLDSSASTFPTSASGGFFELEPFADECWFHGGTLDSTAGRANSYRRHQQIPEPNAVFKVRLRWLNGASVPASNTNAVIQYITVQDYAELTAEITAGRGQTVAGQAVGVAVCSMPTTTVSGTVTANEGTPVTPSASILNSAATTNGTVVKASAGTIFGVVLANNGAADAWFKLHNSTTVTVGTTAVAMWIKVPAGSNVNLQFGSKGLRHATGICYSITGAVADTDTTAVAAGQVKVNLSYV